MESAKQAVIAGGGVTFLSRWAIDTELAHGLLHVVAVEGLDIRRDFFTVRSRSRVLSRAAEALLDFFREHREDATSGDAVTPWTLTGTSVLTPPPPAATLPQSQV